MFIKAIHSSEQEVGRNVRSSKKKYQWKFSIDNVDQEIILLVSSLSGKKEVRHNGRPIHQESNFFGDFRYLHYIQKCLVTIAPRFDSYELYLDNIPFAEYYNTRSINQTHNPQHRPLYNDDNDGYDFSPLKDPEPPKKISQDQLQKLKLTVPKEQTTTTKNQTSTQQQEIWWKQGVNEEFANFGTPSTNGTDNYFDNSGFTFDTPQKESKKSTTQIQQQHSQNQNEKPNPFFEFNQNSWNVQSQPQNNQNFGCNQQPSQIKPLQSTQQYSETKPHNKTDQQYNNMIPQQILNSQNQNQLFNQYNFSNQQQQIQQEQQQILIQQQQQQFQQIQQQQQQQFLQIQQQQQFNFQTTQSQPQSKQQQSIDLLDLFETNQVQQNNYLTQQQEFKKSHSQDNPMQLIIQQNQILNNQFPNQSSNQTQSQYLNYSQSTQPYYRTTQSLIPMTSSYQQIQKQMPKELEDMFDQPEQIVQPPIQRRSTPFDDDLFA